jgi:eukaryotic-like serine/threonine-protein kinase
VKHFRSQRIQDGLEVATNEFKLTRRGKTTVKVKLTEQADALQPNAPGIATAQPSTGWHGWPADAPPPAIAPFDAATAKRHQEAWAKYLKIDIEYTNSLGMKFRLIPPGEFTMGSTPAEIEEALKIAGENKDLQERIKSEAPQHKVILTQPIDLGVHEVTQADYEQVRGKNPSYFATTGSDKAFVEKVAGMATTSHPVEMVSWNDAAEFCAKLSQQEKLKPFYFRAGETVTPLDGTGYRLPSEAEWEFTCRAGTTTKYWIGDKDEELMRAGWFGTNSGGRMHAVGELKGNPFGLYDTHGNVFEWVQDRWEPTYYGQFQEMAAINPDASVSTRSQRVNRGGCCYGNAFYCRASNRYATDASLGGSDLGFRVSLPLHGDPKRRVARVPVGQLGSLPTARKAAFAHGDWRIVGDVIEHPTKDKNSLLLFGSPDFGDGDFTCEVLRSEGGNGMALVARATDLDNYYYFEIGKYRNVKLTSPDGKVLISMRPRSPMIRWWN